MYAFIARRWKTHYREAMRRLQPFATETSSLRLWGRHRGDEVLVPAFPSLQPSGGGGEGGR